MTTITITEFSVEEFPTDLLSGTSKRRARVYLTATTSGADETLDLATIYAPIADIEGVNYETDDGAAVNTSGTAATWSGTTLTSKSTGVEELCITVTLT